MGNFRKLAITELKRVSSVDALNREKEPVIVMLDNIRSMNNIGSIFRTCDAFNIQKLILTGFTAQPPHREIQKTALGATESVPWEYFPNALDILKVLKDEGYKLLAVEQTENSTLLNYCNWSLWGSKNVLILGNEVNGVLQEILNICDACIEIPQSGSKHSFNVTIAAGIVLYERIFNVKL